MHTGGVNAAAKFGPGLKDDRYDTDTDTDTFYCTSDVHLDVS